MQVACCHISHKLSKASPTWNLEENCVFSSDARLLSAGAQVTNDPFPGESPPQLWNSQGWCHSTVLVHSVPAAYAPAHHVEAAPPTGGSSYASYGFRIYPGPRALYPAFPQTLLQCYLSSFISSIPGSKRSRPGTLVTIHSLAPTNILSPSQS